MEKPKNKSILIVEDEPLLHKVLSKRLTASGFTVTIATDGEEAIEILKEVKPSLVLLDIVLPKKSGFEVLAEIRKMPSFKKIPVLILSNLGQEKDKEQLKELGIQEYLVKSDFSLSEMVKKIEEHLAKI